MASKITMRTRVADATAPTAGASGDLSIGELAVNSFAGKLYGGVHIGATTAAGTQAVGATAEVLSWHGLEMGGFTDGTSITVAAGDKLLLNDADGSTDNVNYVNVSQLSTFLGSGDIEGVTAGDGLSGGGTTGTVTLDLDLNELTAAAVDVANDSIAIIDANDSSDNKKESLADYATAIAGAGMTATSGVLNVIAGSGIDVSADAIAVDPSDFITNGSSNKVVVATGADAFAAQDGFEWDPIFGGESSNYRYLKLLASGSKTATPQRVLALKADTSGTVAAGFGTGLMFMIEQPTDGVHQAGAIDVTWEGVADGSEAAQMEFFLETGGTEISQTGADSQVMLLSSGGNLQIDGDMTVSGNNLVFGNGEEIRNTTNGQIDLDAGVIEVGTGSGNPIIQSDGDHNIILRTGNSTTGSITITDGANGDIDIAPNGSGVTKVVTLTATGVITGTTLEATADTAAGDNAAIGYTSAEGLILTGQGSTSDVVIKNDADTLVMSIATGTDDVVFADDVTVSGDLAITGGLTVNGTTTTVNSTTMTVDDPIITLGGDSAPGSDDNKDRGVEFRYHDGSNAKVGFFGWDDSATGFTGLSAATNTSEVFSGTVMNATFGDIAGTLTTVAQTNITSLGAQAATLDMGDNAITNVGDIDADSISVADAAVGLQIDGSGANTSTFDIILGDNLDKALDIREGGNTYMEFETTNSSESINFYKAIDFNSSNMTEVDINSGTIDGTNVTVGSGVTLDVSAGTLTLANNQISGDKVEGGTIAATTITALTIGSMAGNWTNASRTIADLGVVTTVDINGGTLDNVTIAESTINGGTF